VCDCDDNDPLVHPNAPEACDSTKDYNCNGVKPEPCPVGRGCAAGVCVPFCGGEIGCPPGSSCQQVGGNGLCVPTDCTVGGCPPGASCDATSKKCVPNCDVGVVCPPGEKCVAGSCLDPCRDVKCAAGFTCKDGTCNPPCSCFAGDVGCTGSNKCDRPNDAGTATDQCVTPDCVGVACATGQHCQAGKCVGFCDGVKCPPGEVCVPPLTGDAGAAPFGCVNLCAGVSCTAPQKCDPASGKCVSPAAPDGGGLQPTPPAPTADGGTPFDDVNGSGVEDSGGCACSTTSLGRASATAMGFGAVLSLLLLARRRRRH
jgi:MYXO-CTERM domain-containing protein